MREVKQVIVMRKDLNMRKGKMVAQGAHASLAVITNLFEWKATSFSLLEAKFKIHSENPIYKWLNGPFTKICVSVNSEEELFSIYKQAHDKGIPCSLIRDAGKTEFKEPTYTCCGIGPWFSDELDKITGDLKLL